jgi:hypothetical protein
MQGEIHFRTLIWIATRVGIESLGLVEQSSPNPRLCFHSCLPLQSSYFRSFVEKAACVLRVRTVRNLERGGTRFFECETVDNLNASRET